MQDTCVCVVSCTPQVESLKASLERARSDSDAHSANTSLTLRESAATVAALRDELREERGSNDKLKMHLHSLQREVRSADATATQRMI